ncbi:hypothetical protein [Campylobacter devanensis]|uniref:hypothetical protein n=1 Tax=Campylobacter devanensis TaxID=3161138 RepID=UPI00112FB2AE|nr:hypothetical protein [Campylobacter sp. P148]
MKGNVLDIHLGSANLGKSCCIGIDRTEESDIITFENTYMCDNCKNKWTKKVNRYGYWDSFLIIKKDGKNSSKNQSYKCKDCLKDLS